MNPVLRNIFLLIVFSPALLMGQDLNYKVLNFIQPDFVKYNQFLKPLGNIGDINNDGLYEMVTADVTCDSLFIFYLNKDAQIINHKSIELKNQYKKDSVYTGKRDFSVIGDLDGDGILEIAVGEGANNSEVYIFFLNNEGDIKHFNVIDPHIGENPFYSNSKSDEYFGYHISPIGDIDNDGIPDLVIFGLSDRACDSYEYFFDWTYRFFNNQDSAYVLQKSCVIENDSVFPILHLVRLNSDGSVKNHNPINLTTDAYYIDENDTVFYDYKGSMRTCSPGDIDKNGVNDLIIVGPDGFFTVLLNQDYSIKSERYNWTNLSSFGDIYSQEQIISPISDINMDGISEFIFAISTYGENQECKADFDFEADSNIFRKY
ncbi:MAG: hypothetical protein CMP63_08415, partial [Flavobacteriales bacterium]|nr:hypothetical protein [Flavobacteriales bacterium]